MRRERIEALLVWAPPIGIHQARILKVLPGRQPKSLIGLLLHHLEHIFQALFAGCNKEDPEGSGRGKFLFILACLGKLHLTVDLAANAFASLCAAIKL